MTLDEINRLRGLKAKDDGIAFDLEILKVADQLLDAADRAERAERYVDGQDLRSDYRTATEMRAALERAEQEQIRACAGTGCLNVWTLRVALDSARVDLSSSRVELEELRKANAVLRAECEAWREFDSTTRQGEEPMQTHDQWAAWKTRRTKAIRELAKTRAATDAAGALKGVE